MSKLSTQRRVRRTLAVVAYAAVVVVAGKGAVEAVDPKSFAKHVATCHGENRATGELKQLELTYVDVNPDAERTLLMVHGWPSLWHSWKYQIEEFKDDYRLLVPNLRGFGGSTHPGDVQSSGRISDMVDDLVCILNNAKASKVACVGHDWGSQICYEAARMRPDIFEAVVGLCIPYLPYNGPFLSIETLVPMLPKLSYNLYFERNTNDAVKELNADVRRTLRGTLRSVHSPPPAKFLHQTDSFLHGWSAVDTIPAIPFFTEEEEDYWVEQYEKSGFDHTLNFYTHGNRHESWKFAQSQGNHTITAPVLSVLPTKDPVANWVLAARLLKSADLIPELTTKTVSAAHWLQLEKPEEVNSIMRKWLNEWYPPADQGTSTHDEL